MKGSTYQRVNISLPGKTLQQIDAIAEHGDRSRLIDTAVNAYLKEYNRKQLEEAIKEGAIKNAKRDLKFAEETLDLGDLWEY